MKVTARDVRELASRAEGEGQRSLAGLLYAVSGTELSGYSDQLMKYIKPFTDGLTSVLEAKQLELEWELEWEKSRIAGANRDVKLQETDDRAADPD